MIKHMVFFKFKPGLAEGQIDGFGKALADLPRAIPLAKNYCSGRNLSPRDQTYDFGLACDFDDWNAFHEYIDHPAHVSFLRNHLTPLVASRAVVDLEF